MNEVTYFSDGLWHHELKNFKNLWQLDLGKTHKPPGRKKLIKEETSFTAQTMRFGSLSFKVEVKLEIHPISDFTNSVV